MGQSPDRQQPSKEPTLQGFEIWYFSLRFIYFYLCEGRRRENIFGQKLLELNWSLLFTEKLCERIFLRQIAVTEYFRLFLWWRKGSKHCLSLKTGRCLIRSGKGEERTLCDKTKPGLWRGLQERLEVALIQFIFADNYSDISWSRPWNIFLSLF